MELLANHLNANDTPLPLSPSLIAKGVDVKACSYFPSKTVPLKIAFATGPDPGVAEGSLKRTSLSESDPDPANGPTNTVPVIFKVGDDLRQDQLTIQMIRVMDKLWLSEKLDLKMVTFSCVPTGDRQGMVEMVKSHQQQRHETL